MRRGLLHLFLCCTAAVLAISSAAAEADSSVTGIDEKLKEYLSAIRTEPVNVQCGEADFLISACTDSLVRQNVAESIFRYYLSSGVMGLEAVAIHVYDRWFRDGTIKMGSPEESLAARIFSEFNRQSLIGMKAPGMSLRDTSGNAVTVCGTGRWSILYFYDTGCPACIAETAMLENILENDNFDADLYAIYTQDNKEKWTEWTSAHFLLSAGNTRVFHLWDPDMSSGFQMKYGILETPRIFLVDPDGIICGRGLDSAALEELLGRLLSPPSPEYYGSEASARFYDRVFAADGGNISCGDITGIADHIAERTLEDAHDTLLFKQMTGDLLYYLPTKRGREYRCAEEYLIKRHILGRGDVWHTPDDSLKVIGFAEINMELLGRAAAGTRIPDIKVMGTLKSVSGTKVREISLRKLRNDRTFIIFHTAGCEICRGEIAAADSLIAAERMSCKGRTRGTGVFLVDMDEISGSCPETASLLLDAFDLTVLPYITEVDRKGIIRGKYMSLRDL